MRVDLPSLLMLAHPAGGVMATRSRKLTGGAAGLLRYFTERELRGLEGYYRQPGRDPQRTEREGDDVVFTEVWGKYAERLGLQELTRAQFTGLVNGEWEGERLVGAGYRKVVDRETGEVRIETGVRTTMIDVVYAAPKSVMTYLVHRNDPALTAAVIDAWRESVREAFDGMEEHARVARVPVATPAEAGRRTVRYGERAGEESRMQGSATRRVPAELIALPVLQLSARPTEESIARGYVADPHLHMHVPVIAVCAVPSPDDPASVRTYTPDEVGIKRQAAERDADVMGGFARRLEDLGIELEYHTDRKGRITWEVAGVPREAVLRFSTNHLRAEKLAEEFQDRRGRPPSRPRARRAAPQDPPPQGRGGEAGRRAGRLAGVARRPRHGGHRDHRAEARARPRGACLARGTVRGAARPPPRPGRAAPRGRGRRP